MQRSLLLFQEQDDGHCSLDDCPKLTGGCCWMSLSQGEQIAVRELRKVRNVWPELDQPISDRIYELTVGSRY